MITLYSAASLGTSIVVMTQYSEWRDVHIQIVGFSLYGLCCITSIILWIYCYRLHATIVAFVSEIAASNPGK